MNNGIQIIYPRSKYLTLNQAMLEFLENMICEFMNYAKEPIQENFTYTLDISHDEYSFQDYLSVVFYVSFYTGGAHPEHRIVSLVYDISKDQMITMQDLVSEKENLFPIEYLLGTTATLPSLYFFSIDPSLFTNLLEERNSYWFSAVFL